MNSYIGRKSCRCSIRELHGYTKEIEILSTSIAELRGTGKRIVSINLNGVMVLGLRTQLKWRRWLQIFSRNFIRDDHVDLDIITDLLGQCVDDDMNAHLCAPFKRRK
jgi:hypothetical protein